MGERTEADNILAMILILLLPLIIEQSCQFMPNNLVCVAEKSFIEFPEPPKNENIQDISSFSQVITGTVSGASVYQTSAVTLGSFVYVLRP